MMSGANPMEGMSFSKYIHKFLHHKDGIYGTYFDYTEYMWSLKDSPNLLIVYFEDLKLVSKLLEQVDVWALSNLQMFNCICLLV